MTERSSRTGRRKPSNKNLPTEAGSSPRAVHRESGAGWAEKGNRLVETQAASPRALLVAVDQTRHDGASSDAPWTVEESLAELGRLAATDDITVVRSVTQRLPTPHPRTYVGEGKAHELADWRLADDCDIVVFDDELTPSQQRSLEEILGAGTVVDRTQIILDIFAARARTREGTLQVELAQARYQLPRLRRLWTHLERQRGGTGTRGGAGETQMEADRRVLRGQISRLERELEEVRVRRGRQRQSRQQAWPAIALVGYTNAGKSTLLNRLTGADVTARDQLFATLDPTTRRWDLGTSRTALLTDTVGFIHKLPAGLVAAFRATLEELTEADLLLHVVDASSPHAVGQMQVVEAELRDIGATSPVLTVLNKIDRVETTEQRDVVDAIFIAYPDAVAVSAIDGAGIDLLARRTSTTLTQFWATHTQTAGS